MQLFNIAFNNVKKNFKNYFIYIFSMIFSVTIYFIFKSIENNNEINKALLSFAKLNDAFKASAIVIAIFSAVFVWYSNSFFIRKRKKEIGLYSLLGIEKKQIGRMLFYETLAIGTISLGIGIILGIFLSKIFTGILIKLIGIPIAIKFTLSFKAIKDTIIVFLILFVIISVHGYSIIYRYELIDLFKAENKREKEPRTSLILAILSLILIGSGYWIYINLYLNFMLTILLTLVLVISGTYILFGSFMIFVIKISKKNEKKYFNGLKMIAISQLLYRIKGNSKTLATIAILSATTLTATGVSISYYNSFTDQMDKLMPFSYVSMLDENEFDKKFKNIVDGYQNNKLLSEIHVNVAKAKVKLPENKEFSTSIISESQLKEIFNVRKLNYDLPRLKSENEIIVFDEMYDSNFMESYKDKKVTINFESSKEQFNILDFRDYPLFNQHMLFQTFVVKDSVYDKYLKDKWRKVDAYIVDNQNKSEALDKEVNKLGRISSYYSVYKETSTSKGVILFIGIFLGLVFLICTGSIIFFKQLSEAQEEISRYDILRKVGADNKEIKVNIFKQMVFVFLTPFIVGSIHSIVAVSLFIRAFKINLLYISILTIIPYLIIYLSYYFITSNFYYKTVTREI